MMKKRIKYFNRKGVKWTFIGYVAILILSVAFNELFLTDKTTGETISVKERDLIGQKLVTKAINGNLSKEESQYIAKKWSFPYKGKKLYIKSTDEEYHQGLIIVEKKTVNDGKIDAFFYQTPTGMGKVNLTEKIKPVSMKLSGNRLSLTEPNNIKFSLSKSKSEFTITQFTGEDWTNQSPSSYLGERLLYIRIPSDLELVDESNLYLQYVGL